MANQYVSQLKPESYFPTYNDAYTALVEFNKNPYDLEPSITVKELYDKWTPEYFKTLKSDDSARATTSAWQYCSAVYDMRVMDVRARHIKRLHGRRCCYRKRPRADTKRINEE